MVSPYLPYLIKEVVANVNTIFSTRASDPFNVFFDHGLYVSVADNIYKKQNQGVEEAGIFPLIWLITPSIDIDPSVAKDAIYGTATFDMIIAMPTSNEYTQDQRDQLVFIPRLLPIYDELVKQLEISDYFKKTLKPIVEHYRYRPYWGGIEGGTDQKTLFKNFIDAIHVTGIRLDIKKPAPRVIPTLKNT